MPVVIYKRKKMKIELTHVGAPGAKAGAPGAKAGAPGAKAGAPGAKAGAPGAKAGCPMRGLLLGFDISSILLNQLLCSYSIATRPTQRIWLGKLEWSYGLTSTTHDSPIPNFGRGLFRTVWK